MGKIGYYLKKENIQTHFAHQILPSYHLIQKLRRPETKKITGNECSPIRKNLKTMYEMNIIRTKFKTSTHSLWDLWQKY